MPDTNPDGLSVLLPVCNQSGALEGGLAAWSSYLERLGRPYEILVINDGSSDATKAMLAGSETTPGLSKRFPHLHILEHDSRRGFGAALKTGLAAAKHPLIFYTGLDTAYSPSDLKTLLDSIEDSSFGFPLDLVNGYRATTPLTGWRKWRSRVRSFLAKIVLGLDEPALPGFLGAKAHRYALLIRALFGVRILDIDSRFKLFRKKITDRITLQSDSEFVHAELLAKANFLGCMMHEAAIATKPGPFRAQLEPPAAPRGKDLRRVFFRPAFGVVNVSR